MQYYQEKEFFTFVHLKGFASNIVHIIYSDYFVPTLAHKLGQQPDFELVLNLFVIIVCLYLKKLSWICKLKFLIY